MIAAEHPDEIDTESLPAALGMSIERAPRFVDRRARHAALFAKLAGLSLGAQLVRPALREAWEAYSSSAELRASTAKPPRRERAPSWFEPGDSEVWPELVRAVGHPHESELSRFVATLRAPPWQLSWREIVHAAGALGLDTVPATGAPVDRAVARYQALVRRLVRTRSK